MAQEIPFITTTAPATAIQRYMNQVIIPILNEALANIGSVSSVSVNAKNGFSAVITNPTTNAAITLDFTMALAGKKYITASPHTLTLGAINLQTDIEGNLPIQNLGSGANAGANTAFFGDGSWKTPVLSINNLAGAVELIPGDGIDIEGTGAGIIVSPKPNIIAVAASLTLTTANATVLGDATAGAISAFLPDATTASGTLIFKKTDASGNAFTPTGVLGQLIDGAPAYALTAQYQFVALQPYAGNWERVG